MELNRGPILPKKAQIAAPGKGVAPSTPNQASSNFGNPSRPISPSPFSSPVSIRIFDTANNPSITGIATATRTNHHPSLVARMSNSGMNCLHGARSPRRYRDRETGRIVVSLWSEKEKEKAQLCHWPDVSGLNRIGESSIVKSTKELLGSRLGNTDVLVEGVRRAGIWGSAERC